MKLDEDINPIIHQLYVFSAFIVNNVSLLFHRYLLLVKQLLNDRFHLINDPISLFFLPR